MSANHGVLRVILRTVLQKIPNGRDIFVRAQKHFADEHATATEAVQFIIIQLPRDIRVQNFQLYDLLAEDCREECYEFMRSDPGSFIFSES